MKYSFEKVMHWGVWSGGVLFSLWCFCLLAYENYSVLDPADFEKGWWFLKRNKDVSDTEWVVMTKTFKKYWPLLIGQIMFSHIISYTVKKFQEEIQTFLKLKSKMLPAFFAFYSISCLIFIVGKHATFIYVLYILSMYAVHSLGRKTLCYTFTISALFALHHPSFVTARESLMLGKDQNFLVDVGLAWLTARCLSFSIDRIDIGTFRHHKIADIMLVLSYCLYLPVVFTGPILNYSAFVDQLSVSYRKWTSDQFLSKVQLVLKPIIWYFVMELLLHYVYSSSVLYYPELAETFGAWPLCGLGYALPTLFYVKYLVTYGLAGSLARMENFEFPPPPKCISRIHLSSFLWRYFDRGLYLWILRYIYKPLVKGKWSLFTRIVALCSCFTFVCIWHGMDKAICMWCALNFVSVASEMIFAVLSTSKPIKKIDKSLSPANQKRCHALISTPNFMLMCISCTFFLSNWEIGMLVIKKIIFSGWIPLLPTAFIMYCGCHVSMDVRDYEQKKGKLGKSQY